MQTGIFLESNANSNANYLACLFFIVSVALNLDIPKYSCVLFFIIVIIIVTLMLALKIQC